MNILLILVIISITLSFVMCMRDVIEDNKYRVNLCSDPELLEPIFIVKEFTSSYFIDSKDGIHFHPFGIKGYSKKEFQEVLKYTPELELYYLKQVIPPYLWNSICGSMFSSYNRGLIDPKEIKLKTSLTSSVSSVRRSLFFAREELGRILSRNLEI